MPTQIRGWFFLKLLGKGGNGQVWKAFQPTDLGGRLHAVVKLPLAGGLEDVGTLRRMVSEALVLMELMGKPNIVHILDAGIENGILFIVMEYVHGTDLGCLLRAMRRRREPMRVPMALYIAGGVINALRIAHGAKKNGVHLGIVHRDVAPKNVLVSAEGEVKLGDFGIATLANDRTKNNRGTERYMAPEHRDGKPVAKSDVYSWGLMLWEMLEGRRYYSDDPEVFATEQLRREIKAITNPEVSSELAQIVYDALSPDPARRPAAADLHARLRRLLEHRQMDTETAELVQRYFAEARRSGHTEAMLGALPEPSPDLAGLFASADVLVRQGKSPDPHRLAQPSGAAPTSREVEPSVPPWDPPSASTGESVDPPEPSMLRGPRADVADQDGPGHTLKYGAQAEAPEPGEHAVGEPLPPTIPRTDVLPPLELPRVQARPQTEVVPYAGPFAASQSAVEQTAPTQPSGPHTGVFESAGSRWLPASLGPRIALVAMFVAGGAMVMLTAAIGVARWLERDARDVGPASVARAADVDLEARASRPTPARTDEPELDAIEPDLAPRTISPARVESPAAVAEQARAIEVPAPEPTPVVAPPPTVQPAPATVVAASAPSKPNKPKARPAEIVAVDVRLDLVDSISLKVGDERFEIDRDTRIRVPSGKQRVKWLEPGATKWRDAGVIDFRVDRRHTLGLGKLHAKGFEHRSAEARP